MNDRYVKAVLLITVGIISGMFLFKVIQSPAPPAETVGVTVPARSRLQPARIGPVTVSRVIDGDTLVLDTGEKVRLIGIDTPETIHPELPVQRFGEEARDFLKKQVEGRSCVLELEEENQRDKYGRLLAYVFVADRLVNAELIRRGYAYAYTRFPFSRLEEFVELERQAAQAQYGLWNLSLRDGRIANLVQRFESLNLEGRRRLDDILEKLIREYPMESQTDGD